MQHTENKTNNMIEFLEIFFFGKGNVQMAEPLTMAGAGFNIGAGIQIIGSLIGGGARRRAEQRQLRDRAS